MRAIPTRLLVHSCTLMKRTGTDRDRNPTYSETVLRNVRIGATFQTARGNVGETKATEGFKAACALVGIIIPATIVFAVSRFKIRPSRPYIEKVF